MATSCGLEKRRWQSWECCLLLRKCLQDSSFQCSSSAQKQISGLKLKKSVVENDCEQVKELLEKGKGQRLNKLWTFSMDGCTLLVPPLCVAVCYQNLALLQCLLQHGADPNRLGQMDIQGDKKGHSWQSGTSPLLMALEDHPVEGFRFNPAVASALLKAGADINSTAASKTKEEEEEGGSIEYDSGNTPLHRCVQTARLPQDSVFHFLLDNCADLTVKDADGRTVLQKVLKTWHDFPDQEWHMSIFANELIRHGGFCCNNVDNKKSEFKLLLYTIVQTVFLQKPTENVQNTFHLLLNAGYKCSVSDVREFDHWLIETIDKQLAERVHGLQMNSLKHSCRLTIRRNIQSLHSLCKLSLLPTSLIHYLLLKT